MNQQLNLYSGFFIGQYDFTQYVLFMIFIKFENGDKNKFKNRTSLYLLFQWVEKTNGK